MVNPISVKAGENAKANCCNHSKCECNICCWPWKRKHKSGDISPITPKTLQEIEKAVEIYERRKSTSETIYEV